jgi:hypothetical protein
LLFWTLSSRTSAVLSVVQCCTVLYSVDRSPQIPTLIALELEELYALNAGLECKTVLTFMFETVTLILSERVAAFCHEFSLDSGAELPLP